ncbi:MAG: respiratory nitrate reductase subunit gamma [Dehalococcoidales bacterium]|nr:respiratory nitrate reductase subunit gamma [Dehalococcoidales bacterium]
MSGILWYVLVFTALAIFLGASTYRFATLMNLAPHLRWELAPIPGERGDSHGGSHLEEGGWWQKPPKRRRLPGIIYMVREIALMKGIFKTNRALWPFSLLLHGGVYLTVISLILHLTNAIFMAVDRDAATPAGTERAALAIAAAGYLAGATGVLALILKRVLESRYRNFTSPALYFKLSFLLALFASGLGALFGSADFPRETAAFIKDLVAINGTISASPALAVHIVIASLFVACLPFTDMFHFLAKYFTYHAVRWDNALTDKHLAQRLEGTFSRPASWSAPHIAASGKSWKEIITGSNEENATA